MNSHSLTPAEPHYYLQMLVEMLFVYLELHTYMLYALHIASGLQRHLTLKYKKAMTRGKKWQKRIQKIQKTMIDSTE